MPLPPRFDARVASARALTPGVRELTFERADGRPMKFEPGQWVNVVLPVAVSDASDIKRSYSIASPPDGTPRFAIAVTRVQGGPGSTWLHAVEPGAALEFIGPQGFFTRPVSTGTPALMVATGTGVTPMRSMLLSALAAEHPHVRFEATLSQPGDSWAARRGYVQTHVRGLWDELTALGKGTPDAAPHVYVCGLERMVGSVRELLRKGMGLPRQQVHSERYD